jgi:hypothetical protein
MRSNINMQTPSHMPMSMLMPKLYEPIWNLSEIGRWREHLEEKENTKKKNDKNFIFPSSFRLYPSYIYIYRLYTQLQAWRVIAKSNPSRERCGWLAFGNES